MKWYSTAILHTAAKPPAYLAERISDLQHACTISKTSPRDANAIIARTITQLSTHHDDIFIPPLQEAMHIMLDSPVRAQQAVEKIVAAMVAEKDIMEEEQEEPTWMKRH